MLEPIRRKGSPLPRQHSFSDDAYVHASANHGNQLCDLCHATLINEWTFGTVVTDKFKSKVK
jgi:hypothetical protein